MATPCRPGIDGKKTCFSKDLYMSLKALASDECQSNDMDLVRSASKQNRSLGDKARQFLRPEMPDSWRDDPNTWLSNHDIDKVMKQYAETYPEFVYLTTQPSDFMSKKANGTCVSDHCDKKWTCEEKLYGSVVNIDTHKQGGSHWVGLILDCRNLKKPVSYFYDSVGSPYPRTLNSFFKSCRKQFKGSARKYFLENSAFNTKQHQTGGSECGMHSLQFMDAMVRGQSFDDYCAEDHHDTEVFEKRMLFFSA